MTLPTPRSTRSRLPSRAEADQSLRDRGRATPTLPQKCAVRIGINRGVPCVLPMEGTTMQHKKTQVALNHDRHPPVLEVAGARFCGSSRENLVTDLRSIVIAAHKLPAQVDPPARVWRSLRLQLEREGLLSRSVKGRLEEHTRFPMFRN